MQVHHTIMITAASNRAAICANTVYVARRMHIASTTVALATLREQLDAAALLALAGISCTHAHAARQTDRARCQARLAYMTLMFHSHARVRTASSSAQAGGSLHLPPPQPLALALTCSRRRRVTRTADRTALHCTRT